MRESGDMIRHRDMDSIFIQMGLSMKDNGFRICRMGMVLKNGQMDQYFRESIRMGRRMVWVSMFGQMARNMMGSGRKMR